MTTESDLYARIKPHLNTYGRTWRIENAIQSGMPDVFYASGGCLILIENKIMHSGKIHLKPYQWSFAKTIMHQLAPHFLWYLVDHHGVLELYMFPTIEPHAMPPVYAAEPIVSINMEGVKPDFLLKKPSDVRAWLSEIDEMDLNYDYSGTYGG